MAECLAMVAVMASEFIIAYRVSEPISRGDNDAGCQTGFGKSYGGGKNRLGRTRGGQRLGAGGALDRTLAGPRWGGGHVAGRTFGAPGRASPRPGPTGVLLAGPAGAAG